MGQKGSERIRRSKTAAVELSNIDQETLLPSDFELFLGSLENKKKLQFLLRNTILLGQTNLSANIVLSAECIDQETQIQCTSVDGEKIEELDNDIEKADVGMIPHILYDIKSGSQRIVILSNDTDVLVLVLHYIDNFLRKGVK